MNKEKLSAGLCDKCKNMKVYHEGNGYNEATFTTVYCGIDKTEIIPEPESHKQERINVCADFVELIGQSPIGQEGK
jgi:hypothetical protein